MSNVIGVKVFKNTLKRDSGYSPVSGESGYSLIRCVFQSGGDWDNVAAVSAGFFVHPKRILGAVANITTEGEERIAVIAVPGSLLKQGERVHFGLLATVGGVTIATNTVAMDVARGIVSDDIDYNHEEAASLFEQFLNALNTALLTKADKATAGIDGELAALGSDGSLKRSGVSVSRIIMGGSNAEVPTTNAVRNYIFSELDNTLNGLNNGSPSLFVTQDAETGNFKLVYEDSDDNMHVLFDFGQLRDAMETAVIRRFKDVYMTHSVNIENTLVETYRNNPDYSDDYSYSYVPEGNDIPQNEHGRPRGAEVRAPSGAVSICIYDAVTQTERTEAVSGETYCIENLIPGRVYAYTFHDSSGAVCASGTCKTTGQVRMINGGGNTFNIRDLGGWACDGGRIKYGKVFRGCELNGNYFNVSLNSNQQKFFRDILSIRDEIDLRTNAYKEENNINSSALGVGVSYYPVEYKYYQNALTTANSAQSVNIIKRLAENLREDKPTYIHCQAGADRTATLCVMLEAICGVSQSDIDRDYELSSFSWSFYRNGDETPELMMRKRSSGTLGYANYKTYIRNIKNLAGDTFRDKVVFFLLRSGVTIDEINDIRFYLIDGNPERLVSPYGFANVTKSLSNIRFTNTAEKVEMYQPFVGEVIADNMCEIKSFSVVMGGVDCTQSCYRNGTINIERVTGHIVVTGAAEEISSTDNYNDLTNKPQINGHTLSGDKTPDELGLQKKLTAGDNVEIDASGRISAKTVFAVNLTFTSWTGGVMDKTAGQIAEAYNQGKTVIFKGMFDGQELSLKAIAMAVGTEDETITISAIAITEPDGTLYHVYIPRGESDTFSLRTYNLRGIASASVNQNGTISFYDADGNLLFTTSGANLMTSGNQQISMGYDSGGFYFLFDDEQEAV